MDDFMVFMKKYSDWDVFTEAAKEDSITVNMDDINDSVIDGLFEEVESGNLITCDCELDCTPNTDNLVEWLQMYYELRHK